MFSLQKTRVMKRLAILVASVLLLITGVFFAVKNYKTEDTNAATPQVNISNGEWIYWTEGSGLGTPRLIVTPVGNPSVRYLAYCLDPGVQEPSGDYGTTVLPDSGNNGNNRLVKLAIYIASANNATTNNIMNNRWFTYDNIAGTNNRFVDVSTEEGREDFKYIFMHILVGYLSHPGNTDLENRIFNEFNPSDRDLFDSIIADLRSWVQNNNDQWLIAKNYSLYNIVIPTGENVQNIAWIQNDPDKGTINVQKQDKNTSGTPQGGANFQGIHFQVINDSGSRIYNPSNGNFYNNGAVVAEGNTDANGRISFPNLPAGGIKYLVKETATNQSYQLTAAEQSATLSSDGQVVNLVFQNTVVSGKITVNKVDKDTGTCPGVGNASFNGATFQLINNSTNPIHYGGATYAKGAVVDTKSISGNGCSVAFENLPYGSYIIKETAAGTGYTVNTTQQTVNIAANAVNQTVRFENTSIKGKITVSKKDKNTGTCTTQGNATFAQTKFTLYNNSNNPIYYNGHAVAKGAEIASATLNTESCEVVFNNLPYGSYQIKETAVGNGYTLNTTTKTVTIPSNNSVNVAAEYANEAILGKVTVSKTDSKTGTCTTQGNATFNGTTFQITNNSNNPIYYNGKAYAKGAVIDSKSLAGGACSVTFEGLPYGYYIIKETSASAGYKANTATKNVTIPTNNSVNVSTSYANEAILGKVTVNKIDKDTGSCTTTGNLSFDGATFSITNNSTNPVYYNDKAYAKGAVIDTKSLANGACSVTFEGLPYGSYIVKETKTAEGYVLNTTPQTVTIPASGSTNVNVSTTFENQVIRGDVKFVKMDENNDKAMRDVIFSISAVDKNNNITETHIVVSNKDGVVDTSSSFIPHSNHTNGYDALYDEVEPFFFSGYGTWFGIDKKGNPIPVHDEVGALPYGTYIIQELKCGSNLFCTGVLNQKKTITINSPKQVINLGDWDNACTKFSLGTTATDAKDDDKYVEVSKEAKIKDTIDYCVKPNTNFVIKGILMDKSTGEPLLINGKTVEQSIDLRSEEECGQTEMTFTFDATGLGGKDLVVFESIYYKDDLITTHDDLDDTDQTITVVELGTFATNKETGGKVLPLDQDVEIRDEVKYCLKPGQEYTVKGVLMNKNTTSALLINNEPVEQTVTFTPEEACGELEMFFKINTTGLGGNELVVFESLYYDEDLVIEHNDYNNQDETVIVELPVPETGLFTHELAGGSESSNVVYIIGAIVIVSAGGYAAMRFTSRRNFFKKK